MGSCRHEWQPATHSAASPWSMGGLWRRRAHWVRPARDRQPVGALGGVPAADADHPRGCSPPGAQVARRRPCLTWSPPWMRAVAPPLPWIGGQAPCYSASSQVTAYRGCHSHGLSLIPPHAHRPDRDRCLQRPTQAGCAKGIPGVWPSPPEPPALLRPCRRERGRAGAS